MGEKDEAPSNMRGSCGSQVSLWNLNAGVNTLGLSFPRLSVSGEVTVIYLVSPERICALSREPRVLFLAFAGLQRSVLWSVVCV